MTTSDGRVIHVKGNLGQKGKRTCRLPSPVRSCMVKGQGRGKAIGSRSEETDDHSEVIRLTIIMSAKTKNLLIVFLIILSFFVGGPQLRSVQVTTVRIRSVCSQSQA
eukprot:5522466-Amphidinium_carterae.1